MVAFLSKRFFSFFSVGVLSVYLLQLKFRTRYSGPFFFFLLLFDTFHLNFHCFFLYIKNFIPLLFLTPSALINLVLFLSVYLSHFLCLHLSLSFYPFILLSYLSFFSCVSFAYFFLSIPFFFIFLSAITSLFMNFFFCPSLLRPFYSFSFLHTSTI